MTKSLQAKAEEAAKDAAIDGEFEDDNGQLVPFINPEREAFFLEGVKWAIEQAEIKLWGCHEMSKQEIVDYLKQLLQGQ